MDQFTRLGYIAVTTRGEKSEMVLGFFEVGQLDLLRGLEGIHRLARLSQIRRAPNIRDREKALRSRKAARRFHDAAMFCC